MSTKLEKIVGLIVSKTQNEALELARSLQPEIPFNSVDHTNSLLKAIHAQQELLAHLCLITDDYPLDEITVFAKDVRRLPNCQNLVLAFVKSEIPAGFDRNSCSESGVNTVISKQITDKDKSELITALAEFSVQTEIKRRVVNVSKVLNLMLKEVNKACESKKRGSIRETVINSIPADFVADQANWNEEVLRQYYDLLIARTVDSDAPIADKISIPNEILERQLPHLESDTYRGISHRVWEKLQKKHGIKKGKPNKVNLEQNNDNSGEQS